MPSPQLVATFATEEEADAEAQRLNRELGERNGGYFFVATFVAENRWNVERQGGPVPLRDFLRQALKPWHWSWWW